MSLSRRTFLKSAAASAAGAVALEPVLAAPLRLSAPLKVGVIGLGRQGRAILAELGKIDGVEFAGVSDVVAGRLRSGKRRASGAADFSDYRQLLDLDDLQAVCIATPTHAHREIAEAALAAGKHVYCEAPLAHTVDDARAIAAAARQSSTVFATGLLGRSNPVYQLARSFVRSGAIRDLISYRAATHLKTSWRTPASDPKDEQALNWRLDSELSTGLPGEFGTHQLDVVHWFTREYPTRVSGTGGVYAWKDGRTVADSVHCNLTFSEGRQLTWEATLGNSFEGTQELFSGTMGTVKLAWTHAWMFKEADAPTQGWEVYANRQRFHNDEGVTLIAGATKLAEQGKLKDGVGLGDPPLYYALADFVKSITEEMPVVCSAAEGMRATIVGILADEAVRKQATIDINPDIFKTE